MEHYNNIHTRDVVLPLLRIDGIGDAPLTLEPDDAELAAAALLEQMVQRSSGVMRMESATAVIHDAAYYEALAENMRMAHFQERMSALRATAYCEEQLMRNRLPVSGVDSLAFLKSALFRSLDAVEREGGELKRRWQHCLADVTVRRMKTED